MHPETVARVLAQAGPPQRPLKIAPSLPFIREMLAKVPTLTASRVPAMVWERGSLRTIFNHGGAAPAAG